MSQRLDMLEKLIAKGGDDPFAHYARAMELRGLERHPEAMIAFRELRTRFPSYVPTYLMAAELAITQGERTLARDYLEEGIKRAREVGDAHAESELTRALSGLT
jgi:tetratricopeptide (TPR) repeat protein